MDTCTEHVIQCIVHNRASCRGEGSRNALTRSSACGREEIGACDETGIDGNGTVAADGVTVEGGGMAAGSEHSLIATDDERTRLLDSCYTCRCVYMYMCIDTYMYMYIQIHRHT